MPADRHIAGAQEHRERGESVGPRVQTVGDERGRPDLPSDRNPVCGHHLVADEPDQSREGDDDQAGHRAGMKQPVDRLVRGDG